MKFSEMIWILTISILRQIVDASEHAPLFLIFYNILEDSHYYLSKHVGGAIKYISNDRCEIS